MGEGAAGRIFISNRRTDTPHVAGRLFDRLEQASWLVPARWAYAMGAATTGITSPGDDPDPFWAQHTGTYVFDIRLS